MGRLNANALADEFNVRTDVMSDFISHFAPDYVTQEKYREASDTMLFVHIPKTAGVSIGKAFQSAFDQFYGVQWDNIAASFRNATRNSNYNQSRADKRQVIMGHYGWSELQLWRNHDLPLKCGTIFRDPVARLISNYNYNCSPSHPASDAFKAKHPTLEIFAQGIAYDVQLTQAIGMVASFENALEKLMKYYTFLGITEKLPASLKHLSLSHGLPQMTEHRENIGTKTARVAEDSIRTIVANRGHNDLKLHRLLTIIYDI